MKTTRMAVFLILSLLINASQTASGQPVTSSPVPKPSATTPEPVYEHDDTRELVRLVDDAADLIRSRGEASFGELRTPDSRWRRGEMYVFVLDPKGEMLVHPDPTMEGKNKLDLKDINGKPIIQGLIAAATSFPTKAEGWYHYQWPVPGGLLPRWKSSYVRFVQAPSGKSYIVGSGIYNDRMEKAFVVDAVNDAVAQIEKSGKSAFSRFHDPKGPFLAKDTYIFVYDMKGRNLVLPPFPNLEGRDLLDMKDTDGKPFIRVMIDLVQTSGSGWVDYMWPKPGESIPTQKSAYVCKAKMGDQWVLVGSGVYLADARKVAGGKATMSAPDLMKLVREGAAVLEKQGENAYPEFRKKGSPWFRDNTYLFVASMDGTSVFHAADPTREGRDNISTMDIIGRPYVRMFVEAVQTSSGEGWVH